MRFEIMAIFVVFAASLVQDCNLARIRGS
jgi:hypothetical protein